MFTYRMTLQPSIILTTNNSKVQIPELDEFKSTNEIASTVDVSNAIDSCNTYTDNVSGNIQRKIDSIQSQIDNIVQKTLESIYKVGDYIITQNNENPASRFGGTWELVKDRFLIGAGNKYGLLSEGGEEEHKLDLDEMPSHNHTVYTPKGDTYWSNGSGNTYWGDNTSRSTGTTYAGSSKPHNNMPPYIAVYIWRKIA